MQTASNSFPNNKHSNNQAYPPSVPLSVYRQLAGELQAAQAKLETLTVQNQQLTKENQVLRQEINKTIESVLNLQNLLNSQNQVSQSSADSHTKTKPQSAKRPRPPVMPQTVEIFSPIPPSEPVFIEQEVHYYTESQPESLGLRGWWLLLALLLIIITAFGTGYFIVRPLVEKHTR